jgi:hypothetical protein
MTQQFFIWIVSLILTVCITSCNTHQDASSHINSNGWDNEYCVTKTVKNIIFTFPADGWAFSKRDSLIDATFAALKHNTELIHVKYTDTIRVVFLSSRKEMKKHTSMPGSGETFPDLMTSFIVAKDEQKHVKPPLKHELMHLITMSSWGNPVVSSQWMNEGLAAYAENNCNNYQVEQIYSYLTDRNMLLPMDTMINNFYNQSEMIRNHQSAYIIQFLLDNYGVDKLKKLWIKGFNEFENIYGISYGQLELQFKEKLKQKYPTTPAIEWDSFSKGCR